MERRSEARIRTYQNVELTVLGKDGFTVSAHAIEFSGHGFQLVVTRPIPVNVPVKIEDEDWIVLGDICYCRPERSHFAVGVQIEQVLAGLHELHELNRHLLDGTRRQPEGIPASTSLEEAEQLVTKS